MVARRNANFVMNLALTIGSTLLPAKTSRQKLNVLLEERGLMLQLSRPLPYVFFQVSAQRQTLTLGRQSSGYTQAIDYLRENGRLMAVGLPAKATLDASIFFTVFKSITIHGSYVGNRQDAIECINIAASGAVKVHYQLKPIDELEKCVFLYVVLDCVLLTFGVLCP